MIGHQIDQGQIDGGARGMAGMLGDITQPEQVFLAERRVILPLGWRLSAVLRPHKAEQRLKETMREMTPPNWGRSITTCMEDVSRYSFQVACCFRNGGVAFAVEGDGVCFETESYAASALYTTLASLSGALWRIRRASVLLRLFETVEFKYRDKDLVKRSELLRPLFNYIEGRVVIVSFG